MACLAGIHDPFRKAPCAPMALLHLATLLRGQNRAAEAADVLAQCRKVYEPDLTKEPGRAGWIPLLHAGVGAVRAWALMISALEAACIIAITTTVKARIALFIRD